MRVCFMSATCYHISVFVVNSKKMITYEKCRNITPGSRGEVNLSVRERESFEPAVAWGVGVGEDGPCDVSV